MFGPPSSSFKIARSVLRLQEFLFTIEYLSGRKNTITDAIQRLNTTGSDNNGKRIDLEVPVLSIEDGVNPPTLDDHDIAKPDKNKDDQPKPVDAIPIDEMLSA